jgi:cytochrome c oxidase subunit 4
MAHDSHNAHAHHDDHGGHSHAHVGPFTLVAVLLALLVFTVLTVGQAQAEVYLQSALDMKFPAWVNIVVVMAIACVKAALVMAFFMQLKYDNPINTAAMVFCFAGVIIFIGFTSMDLLTRDRVTPWKAGQVVKGGTIVPVKAARDSFQTIFFTDAAYRESRLVSRLIDTCAHDLAGRADFYRDQAREDAIAASEAVAHVASEIRDGMLYRKPIPNARRHAQDLLTAAAAKSSSGAQSLINECARLIESQELPGDSEAALKADFEALASHSHSKSHGLHEGHGHVVLSTKNMSRPRVGASGALFTAPADPHAHDSSHDAAPSKPAGAH